MLPLLKTLELLLEEDVFDDLMMTERLQFAEKLLIAVRMELRGSKQISKLCVGANVVVCLAAYCEVVRDKALALTITLLGHRVSRRRQYITYFWLFSIVYILTLCTFSFVLRRLVPPCT